MIEMGDCWVVASLKNPHVDKATANGEPCTNLAVTSGTRVPIFLPVRRALAFGISEFSYFLLVGVWMFLDSCEPRGAWVA